MAKYGIIKPSSNWKSLSLQQPNPETAVGPDEIHYQML